MEESLERIYTIPLRKVKWSSRNGQADRAIRAIRQYLIKHMKADEVWIDAAVNHHLWSRGKFKVPSKVRIRARLFDDGVCEVSLPEEETTAGESMREQMAEAKERKLEEAHKGEVEAAERAMAEGAATPSGLTKPTTADEDEDEVGEAPDEGERSKEEPEEADDETPKTPPKTEKKSEKPAPKKETEPKAEDRKAETSTDDDAADEADESKDDDAEAKD